VGDTTTTMMWIAGVSPARVFEASIGATVALFIFGIPAAIQQHKYSPILKRAHKRPQLDWTRVGIVGLILVFAVVTNVTVNMNFPKHADRFPFIGAAVWTAILLSIFLRRPDWKVLPEAFKGSLFLVALVLCASMMPVEQLPTPSWQTAFGLGLLSSVFDNIPLTALALKQGGYDWGFLAYTVGFGGSILWFGSSSGVALSNMYPEARSVVSWLRYGWAIPFSYAAGFFAMLWLWHWHPDLS
jgi:Na+/H+ antiporter NhaD/arsenite permease-like protein